MSLEDRIRNTGEHLLGSLDHDPDLDRRIHERVEHRAHQRRQRAAAGLGAGVVVVLGGLVVMNVDRSEPSVGVASGPSAPSVSSMIAGTTVVTAPTTTLPVTATTASPLPMEQPASTPMATIASTVLTPLGEGAPTLFTSLEDGSDQWAIDLATGLPTDVDHAATVTPAAATDPASGARFELDRSDPTLEDRCGQHPVTALDPNGQPVAGFPQAAAAMTTSRDGSTGLIRYAACPEGGTLEVDGPTSLPVEWRLAWFLTDDPAAALTPLSGSWGEVSDDGRYVLLEDTGGAPTGIVETSSGAEMPLLPDGCESPRKDPEAGYLIGSGGTAALASCDGQVSLVAGPVGGATVIRALDGCGQNAMLSVLDPSVGEVEQNWFAVADLDAKQAWVIGSTLASEAIPVGDRVAWRPFTEIGH